MALVVAMAIVALSVTSLSEAGLKTVGELPQGLPDIHWPSLRLRDVDGVLPLALACFLLAYIESVSAARTLARKNGYEIDPRQELLGLGVANLSAAARGSDRRRPLSVVRQRQGGSEDPLALVFASAAIALCLLFLTGLLRNLPTVVLAAIVLVAVKGLVDLPELKRLFARAATSSRSPSSLSSACFSWAFGRSERDARGVLEHESARHEKGVNQGEGEEHPRRSGYPKEEP